MRMFAIILAALAASTLNWSGTAMSAPVPSAPAPKEVRLSHISMTEMGSGDPILLIPGLSTPRSVWDEVAPQLAKGHRVVLVQINGFGGDDPGDNLKPDMLAGVVGELHAFIAANKLGPARIVGHSLGGLVALQLAQAHPGDASALMIVDSLPYVGDIFVPGATIAQLEPQAKAMRDHMVASFGEDGTAAARRTATTMALTPAAQAKVASWIATADPRVAGEAMYEDLTTDLRPAMSGIMTPITLVFPYSEALPKDQAEPFYRAEYATAPAVTFVAIADAGHFVMLDQPEAFAAAIERFAD